MANTNRLLFELGDPQGFVTVFYGVLEVATGRLGYCRAGHDRPLLLRGEQVIQLGGEGMVLAAVEGSELLLSEETLQLYPGDRLVLYTDGLPDAMDQEGAFFGMERLEAVVQASADLPGEQACAFIFQKLDEYQFGASQFDDMTLVLVDFTQ
jgi:phosphoserine phosphatase RsbU/P